MLQKNSLEDNCKDILDNIIKNLHPTLYHTIYQDVLSANLKNNKKTIASYVKSRLGIASVAHRIKKSKQYWTIRGWSDAESYVKSKENKQKNAISVYSREFWLKRINPETGINYTLEEADFERNSRRPIRKEYWIKKGYTEIESQQLALESKSRNNKLGAKSSSISNIRRITSKRCIEYYTAQGYTESMAKELVSKGQKHFSKTICIEKYGEIEGLKIWQNRQQRWLDTLNSKSDDEKSRINRLKLTKGITLSKAEKFILNEIKHVFPEVCHQFTLFQSNKKRYVYDIVFNNKIIEYNGDFWHCNPKIYPDTFINPRTKLKASDKWAADKEKIKFAECQGYEVLVIWESDFKQNKEKVIKECIQFLTR